MNYTILGKVVGDSAYEVAVEQGFNGTENEWLESLKGEKGDTGNAGADGTVEFDSLTDAQIASLKGEAGTQFTTIGDDLTLESTDDGNVLQLADRPYTANSHKGKGYKILRENLVDGVNTLTQTMISSSNTIYEIRYDFDLDGQTIEIPEGCTLKFEGGSFSNGTMLGAQLENKDTLTPELFGAKGDGVTDDTLAVRNCVWLAKHSVLNGSYKVKADWVYYSNRPSAVVCQSNSVVEINGTLSLITQNQTGSDIISVVGCSNVNIIGIGYIIGDRDSNEATSGSHGMGINILGSNNISVKGLTITKCYGDGIYIGPISVNSVYQTSSIIYIQATIYYCRRQGVSVTAGDNITFDNCTIHTINGTSPKSCIDLEQQWDDLLIYDIVIKNSYFTNDADCLGVVFSGAQNVLFYKSTIEGAYTVSNVFGDSDVTIIDSNLNKLSGKTCTITNSKIDFVTASKDNANLYLKNCSIQRLNSGSTTSNIHFYLDNCTITKDDGYDDSVFMYMSAPYSYIHANNCTFRAKDYYYYAIGFMECNNCIFDLDTTMSPFAGYARNCTFILGNKNQTSSAIQCSTSANYPNDLTLINCNIINTNTEFDFNYVLRSSGDYYLNSINTTIFNHSRSSYRLGNVKEYNTVIVNDGELIENYYKVNTTSNRPIPTTAGFQYFDTTLNQPIWWTGTAWVGSSGEEVN